MVVQPFDDFQIRAVHIDGIVHHSLVQAVAGNNLPLAAREMGSIGLRREVTRIVVSLQADLKLLERDVFTKLCQQPHPFGIVHPDVLQARIHVVRQEYSRRRPPPSTHHEDGTRHQLLVLPGRRLYTTVVRQESSPGVAATVTGVVDNPFGRFFKRNAPAVPHRPAVTVCFEHAVLGNTVLHPRSRLEGDALPRVVLHNLYLRDMWIGKVYTEISQRAPLRTEQRDWQHPPMKDKRSPAAVQRQPLHVLQSKSHFLRIVLIVIGNIVLPDGRTFFIEMIGSFVKTDHYAVTVSTFGLDFLSHLLPHGRRIFRAARLQAKVGHIIHTDTLCTQRERHPYSQQKQAQRFHFFHDL